MKKIVEELTYPIRLELETKVPEKWLAIDLETRNIWQGKVEFWEGYRGVWKRASPEFLSLLRKMLEQEEGSREVVERKKNENS